MSIRRRRRGDAGMSSIELVLIMPAVILGFMLLVQVAVKANAERAAQAAAEEGADIARVYGGSATEGEDTAATYAARMGEGTLHNVDVHADRDGQTATVTVTGTATSLLGFTIAVEQTSTGPVERFAPEDGVEP